jgi:hypothetical protein
MYWWYYVRIFNLSLLRLLRNKSELKIVICPFTGHASFYLILAKKMYRSYKVNFFPKMQNITFCLSF